MLIACVGIPCCGKSTITRHLAESVASPYFVEPEEGTWPELVTDRDVFGYFNCIHAFRGLRIPSLYKAQRISEDGGVVFLDTFYDKLCCHWLGKPGMEWLLEPEDPYFENFKETALLDYQYLPDADVIILIKIAEVKWKSMLKSRGRKLDMRTNLDSIYTMQAYFEEASKIYTEDRREQTRLICFENDLESASLAAIVLRDQLCHAGIIS